MKNKLTKIEKKLLRAQRRRAQIVYNDIESSYATEEEYDIVEKILKDRNIKKPRIENILHCDFKNVPMHIDDFYPKGFRTLIVPICGKGELQYTEPSRDKKLFNLFNAHFDTDTFIVFNDCFPHSFSAKQNCQAIICGIPLRHAKILQSGYEVKRRTLK